MSKRSVEAQTAKRIEGAVMDVRGLMALAERVMGNLPQSREFESVINDLMAIQHHGARIQEALGNSQEDLHDLISQQADDLMLTITQPGGLLQQLEEVRSTC